MSNSLDRICTVDISLASPISNDANFDNILILGPAPANPTEDVPAVGVYNSLEELTALGIIATGERADPVGVAARVAFSQSPRPHEVYVAFMGDIVDKESENAALQTVSAVLENALAVNGWYCICPVGLADEKVKEIIQWTETQNKLCGYIDKDPEKPIVEAGLYLRSFPFFPKETADQLENDIPADNLYGMAVEKIVEVTKEVPVIRDVKVSTPASNPNMAAELAAAKAKCEMLQIMYESLLNRVLAGKAG